MENLLEMARKNLEDSLEYEMERIAKEIPKIDEAILEAAKKGYNRLFIVSNAEYKVISGDMYIYDYKNLFFKDKIEQFISHNYSKRGFRISYSTKDDIIIVWDKQQ